MIPAVLNYSNLIVVKKDKLYKYHFLINIMNLRNIMSPKNWFLALLGISFFAACSTIGCRRQHKNLEQRVSKDIEKIQESRRLKEEIYEEISNPNRKPEKYAIVYGYEGEDQCIADEARKFKRENIYYIMNEEELKKVFDSLGKIVNPYKDSFIIYVENNGNYSSLRLPGKIFQQKR